VAAAINFSGLDTACDPLPTKLAEVASTSCRKKLRFGAAVEDTDRSSDQLKV
jgi:hypothetical protein